MKKSPAPLGGLVGAMIAWSQSRAVARRRTREMVVLETLSLGGKRELALVVVNQQRFLVGMGEGVTAIAPVSEERSGEGVPCV